MKRGHAKIAVAVAVAVVDMAEAAGVAEAAVVAAVTSANAATGNQLVFLFQNAELALGRIRVLVEAIHQ